MIEQDHSFGFLGQFFVSIATSVAAAWRFVTWRVSKLEAQITTLGNNADATRERDRAANHSDIQRLEGKVDRHHEIVMGHLMEIKGRLNP